MSAGNKSGTQGKKLFKRLLLYAGGSRCLQRSGCDAWGEISDETRQAIEDKKRENAELEELHKADSTKEVSAERRTDEAELTSKAAEKAQLTQEIGDIEAELEALKAREAELRRSLSDKQSELNGLEEK